MKIVSTHFQTWFGEDLDAQFEHIIPLQHKQCERKCAGPEGTDHPYRRSLVRRYGSQYWRQGAWSTVTFTLIGWMEGGGG